MYSRIYCDRNYVNYNVDKQLDSHVDFQHFLRATLLHLIFSSFRIFQKKSQFC